MFKKKKERRVRKCWEFSCIKVIEISFSVIFSKDIHALEFLSRKIGRYGPKIGNLSKLICFLSCMNYVNKFVHTLAGKMRQINALALNLLFVQWARQTDELGGWTHQKSVRVNFYHLTPGVDPPPTPPFWQLNHANSAYFGAISANFSSISTLGPSFCKSWVRPCKRRQHQGALPLDPRATHGQTGRQTDKQTYQGTDNQSNAQTNPHIIHIPPCTSPLLTCSNPPSALKNS